MSESYLSAIPVRDALRQAHIRGYHDSAKARHRLAMSLFGPELPDSPRSSAQILFRLETVRKETRLSQRLLVRSAIPPDEVEGLEFRQEDFSWIRQGQEVTFRVTASPIRRKSRSGSEYHLRSEEEQEQWLAERLAEVLVIDEILDLYKEDVLRNPGPPGGPRVPLVQFDGLARVEDSARLQEVLVSGVGRNKNYGAGLLTVRNLG